MRNVIYLNQTMAQHPPIDLGVDTLIDNLYQQFEPLLESIRAQPEQNHAAALLAFQQELEQSQAQLAELEQMTEFLFSLNQKNHSN